MKNNLILILLIALAASGCRSSKTAVTGDAPSATPPAASEEMQEHVWDFRDATTWILGDFSLSRLLDPPHSTWYLEGYANYVPDKAIMDELKQTDITDYSITIVLGTWCPDSRREVPRFMKILDLIDFPSSKVTFIGVDNSKQAPVGDYDKLEIERVPTFIFLRNKVEAGRIIENPVTSLEQDMLNILTRNEK